jgi:hypothetical protein
VSKYKTVYCTRFKAWNRWRYKDRCRFAHFHGELRNVNDPIPFWVVELYNDEEISDLELEEYQAQLDDIRELSDDEPLNYTQSIAHDHNYFQFQAPPSIQRPPLFQEPLPRQAPSSHQALLPSSESILSRPPIPSQHVIQKSTDLDKDLQIMSLKAKLKKSEKFKQQYLQQTHRLAALEAENLRMKSKDGKKGAEDILSDLINRINDLFEWNIMWSTIVTPVVLKSGNTIDEATFDSLERDPYDRTKMWDEKIYNYFARDLRDVLEEAIQEIQQSKSKTADFGTQTSNCWFWDNDGLNKVTCRAILNKLESYIIEWRDLNDQLNICQKELNEKDADVFKKEIELIQKDKEITCLSNKLLKYKQSSKVNKLPTSNPSKVIPSKIPIQDPKSIPSKFTHPFDHNTFNKAHKIANLSFFLHLEQKLFNKAK